MHAFALTYDGARQATGGGAPKGKTGEKIFNYPYEDYYLDSNGLHVIIVPLGDDFPGIVSTHITVNAGSKDEVEPGKTGMAHFFEHMMFRGTSNVSSEDFDATFDELGATYNAWTWLENTNYYATFPKTGADGSNNLEKIMFLESDRFRFLNYTEDDFKTEAGAILGEYNYYQDKIWNELSEVRYNLSYSVHTYRHPVLGTLEDIRDMPNELEYSRVFFERFYKPENIVLMVFGDVDVNETKAIVDEYWSGWERGEGYVSEIPQEPLRDSAVYQHVEWPEASTPWLSVSFNAPNFTVTDVDSAALDIIQYMIFSPASDLYKKLVVDEQVVLDLKAWYYWFKDPSLFVIEANVESTDSLWYARDEILKTLAQLRIETVSTQELDRAKSSLKYAAAMNFVSTKKIASDIQYYVALTGSPEGINQIYALYETITPEIVLEVADKYFNDNRLATITLAHAGESLPQPPSIALADANLEAGSVDAFVEAFERDDGFAADQVIMPSSSSKLVHFDIRFRVGASDDPEGKEGLAALTTKMLSSAGSSSLTYEQIQDLLFPMASSWAGGSGKEYTYFYGTVHVDHLVPYYDIVSEMLLDPGFREEDFDRIKTEKIRAIEDAIYDDGTVRARAFDATIFEGHPFDHSNGGTIDSLKSITIDDVKEFYAAWFTKQSVILGMAGGFSRQFLTKVNRDLGTLPDGAVDKALLQAPATRPASSAVIIEQQATQATTVTFGFSLPAGHMSRGHPDYPALVVALNYFGSGGFSSKLMSEIRVKRGLNYGSNARLRFGGMALQVNLGAMDTTEIAHFATRLAMREINKLLTQGMDQEQFNFVRNSIVNQLPVAVDTPSKILSLAMEGHEYGFGDDYLGYMLPALRNTTVAQVNDVIKKWMQDESVTFVFVTPQAADLKARLMNETESTITYNAEEKPEEQLMDDEIIKDYPLGLMPNNIEIKTATDFFPGTGALAIEVQGETVVLKEDHIISIGRRNASNTDETKTDKEETATAGEAQAEEAQAEAEEDVADMMASSNGDDIDTMDVEVAVTDDAATGGSTATDSTTTEATTSAGNLFLSVWGSSSLVLAAFLALLA